MIKKIISSLPQFLQNLNQYVAVLINDKRAGKPSLPQSAKPVNNICYYCFSGFVVLEVFSPAFSLTCFCEQVNKVDVAFVALKEIPLCAKLTTGTARETKLSTPPAGMRKLDNRLLSEASQNKNSLKPPLQG